MMLIVFDVAIADMIELDKQKLASKIGEILRAHRIGHHLVVIPRDLGDWIIENVPLGLDLQSTCKQIRQSYTQTGALSRQAAHYIRIVKDKTQRSPGGPGEVLINLDHIDIPHMLDRTILLVEDAVTDGRLFDHIARYLIKRNKSVYTNFEISHGGGERILDILEGHIADNRIVVAILDSDRNFPGDPPSKKIEKVLKLLQERNCEYCQLVCFLSREIENAIPLSIIAELACSKEKGAAVDFHLKVGLQEDAQKIERAERLWYYFDLKNGLSVEQLDKLGASGGRKWIETKLKMAGVNSKSVSISGFGPNIVPLLLRDARILDIFLQGTISQTWAHFGNVLFPALWLGAASGRSYV